jgi:hypothetical protein
MGKWKHMDVYKIKQFVCVRQWIRRFTSYSPSRSHQNIAVNITRNRMQNPIINVTCC